MYLQLSVHREKTLRLRAYSLKLSVTTAGPQSTRSTSQDIPLSYVRNLTEEMDAPPTYDYQKYVRTDEINAPSAYDYRKYAATEEMIAPLPYDYQKYSATEEMNAPLAYDYRKYAATEEMNAPLAYD
jgi:hypothetical protein